MASSSPDAIIIVSPSNDLYVKGALQYDMLFATTCNIQSICFGYSNMYMKIASNGNVGIGTSNPIALLDVSGNVNIRSNLTVYQNATFCNDITSASLYTNNILPLSTAVYQYPGICIQNVSTTMSLLSWNYRFNGAGYVTGTNSTGSNLYGAMFRFDALNGSIQYRCTSTATNGAFNPGFLTPLSITNSTGNVGIGTTTPAYQLDVAGTIRSTTTAQSSGNIIIASSIGNISFIANAGPGQANSITQAGDSFIQFNGNTGIDSGNLVIAPWSSSGAGIRMLGANGNVGIGVASPSYKLDVNGDINTNATIRSVTHSNSGALQVGGWIYGLNSALATSANNLITSGKALSTNNTVNYRYTHRGGDGSTNNYVGIGFWGNDDILNVVATGNVGVGTTSPSYKLDVNGDINTNTTIRSVTHSNSGNMQIGGNTFFTGAVGGNNNSIITGTGDGGSIATYNVAFKSHWGIGFPSYDGGNRITFDTRNGNISSSGTIYAAFSGNVTGNCSGSSGSCTGNAATASLLNGNDNGSSFEINKWYRDNSGRTDSHRFYFENGGRTYLSSPSGRFDFGTTASTTGAIYCGTINTGAISCTTINTNGNTITGNVTGNCSGSSGSCTGNAASSTTFNNSGSYVSSGDGWFRSKISGTLAYNDVDQRGIRTDSTWVKTYPDRAAFLCGTLNCTDINTNGNNITVGGASITAGNFYGYLNGNISGSSTSCSGNAATATYASYGSYGLRLNTNLNGNTPTIDTDSNTSLQLMAGQNGNASGTWGVRIDSSGNVFANTSLRAHTLMCTGGSMNIKSEYQIIYTADYDGNNGGADHVFYASTNERMRLTSGGNLSVAGSICCDGSMGVGTFSPTAKLHVLTNSYDGSDPSYGGIYCYNPNYNQPNSICLRTNQAGNPFYSMDVAGVRGWSMGIHNGDGNKFKIRNNWNFTGSDVMTLTSGGNLSVAGYVSIGTNSPSYPLHVATTTTSPDVNSYAYYNQNGSIGTYAGDLVSSVSAFFAGRIIVSGEVNVVSDERTKQNIKYTDADTIISKVNQLKPCTFSYIDIIEKGNSSKYGFIAQEVEDLFPTCVSKIHDHIPDIFTLATVQYISEDMYMITIPKIGLDLKEKDNLKIAFGDKKENFNIVTVLENQVNSSTEITIITTEKLGDQVFIIGRMVDDFRVLNYEQLTTVAISAIQELGQINKKLEDRIELLEKLYKDIARKID